MSRSAVLSVGDSTGLGFGRGSVRYAGMPSDKVFSIVQSKVEFIYRGYAWNLFFPHDQGRIRINGVNIDVEHVTPEEIRISF
jgi:hypothetical protein